MLTKELIPDLWTKTYNTEGKPDWSHILPYHDDNIYFRDSAFTLQKNKAFLLSRKGFSFVGVRRLELPAPTSRT